MGEPALFQLSGPDVIKEPELALEILARLFYDDCREEAIAAASRVVSESEIYLNLGISPDMFVDFAVFCGYLNLINGRQIPLTEQDRETASDIQRFIEYFKQERRASQYSEDGRTTSWSTMSYSASEQ